MSACCAHVCGSDQRERPDWWEAHAIRLRSYRIRARQAEPAASKFARLSILVNPVQAMPLSQIRRILRASSPDGELARVVADRCTRHVLAELGPVTSGARVPELRGLVRAYASRWLDSELADAVKSSDRRVKRSAALKRRAAELTVSQVVDELIGSNASRALASGHPSRAGRAA